MNLVVVDVLLNMEKYKKMTLKQKLKRLSNRTPCVVDFLGYSKSGTPKELLETLSEEELGMIYRISIYTVFKDGNTEMLIKVKTIRNE